MKINIGIVERLFRIVMSIAIIILSATGMLSGATAIILLVTAVVFIITSFIGFCPLYRVCNFSSKQHSQTNVGV
jgi:hypothetical protein